MISAAAVQHNSLPLLLVRHPRLADARCGCQESCFGSVMVVVDSVGGFKPLAKGLLSQFYVCPAMGFILKNAILFLAIFIGVIIVTHVFVTIGHAGVADYSYSGFPLKYTEGGGMCVNGPCQSTFSLPNFIMDFIILAMISFAIYYGLLKLKVLISNSAKK
jgi:hypothetical protein